MVAQLRYEAIVGAGIKVMQRVTLPEDYVKENMKVEISAKVASGYHTESMGSTESWWWLGVHRKFCTFLVLDLQLPRCCGPWCCQQSPLAFFKTCRSNYISCNYSPSSKVGTIKTNICDILFSDTPGTGSCFQLCGGQEVRCCGRDLL